MLKLSLARCGSPRYRRLYVVRQRYGGQAAGQAVQGTLRIMGNSFKYLLFQ